MSAISSLTHAISLDPYSGEQIGAYPFDTDAALEAALQRAKVGYRQWRQVSLGQRSEYLLALASTLETKAEAFAQMISREIGKPVAQARGEVSKCVGLCRWYAEHGPAMLAPEPTQVEKARIEYRPLGPILAVMPWNFPIWQVLRGAVPALLAGNVYVLKHAPNVMGSAYLLLDAIKRAGFPQGVFEVLNVTPDGVSNAIADPRIAAVTLTGSVRAGIAIGAQAVQVEAGGRFLVEQQRGVAAAERLLGAAVGVAQQAAHALADVQRRTGRGADVQRRRGRPEDLGHLHPARRQRGPRGRAEGRSGCGQLGRRFGRRGRPHRRRSDCARRSQRPRRPSCAVAWPEPPDRPAAGCPRPGLARHISRCRHR